MATPDQLIGELVGDLDPGSFVTKYVVVAEVIDADGERGVWCTGSDDLKRWDTYGLLTEALMIQRTQHIADRLRDDE